MEIVRQPIGRGLLWLTEGLRIMSRQPVALFAMTFLSLAIMVIPSIIPGLGTVLSLALQPAIYVGLMSAIRAADNGESPHPRMIFSAFKSDNGSVWQSLLMLGSVNAALSVLVFGIVSVLLSGDSIDPMPDTTEPTDIADLGSMLWSMGLFAVLFAPVQMALWYSPLLVGWHRLPVGKSLFFSVVAVWRNKGAFCALFLGWFAIMFVLVLVINILIMGLGLAPTLMSMLIAPLSMMIIAAAYCSFWVTYKDVIREQTEAVVSNEPDAIE